MPTLRNALVTKGKSPHQTGKLVEAGALGIPVLHSHPTPHPQVLAQGRYPVFAKRMKFEKGLTPHWRVGRGQGHLLGPVTSLENG